MPDTGEIWGDHCSKVTGHIWKCFQKCFCVPWSLHMELRLKARAYFSGRHGLVWAPT